MSAVYYRIPEWSETFLDGAVLSGTSCVQMAQKLTDSGILEILEMRSGIRIKSNSHVGRVSFEEFQVEVCPKLRGIQLARLLQYAYGLKDFKLFNQTHYDTENLDFFDLLIYALYICAQNLLNRGIMRGYTLFEDDISSVKGRVDMGRVASHGGAVGASLPCRYYHRSEDSPLNRALLAGLRFAGEQAVDLNLKHGIRNLCCYLSTLIRNEKLDRQLLSTACRSVNRLTDSYRPALKLIGMLFNAQTPRMEGGFGKILIPGCFFDMNLFFEALVSKLLKTLPEEYTIIDQYRLGRLFTYETTNRPQGRRSPVPRPDFALLKNGSVEQLLDAKYRDLWENNLPREMLYQLAIYAVGGIGSRMATILYPAVNELPSAQQININDPLRKNVMAKVLMKPINLTKVANYLEKGDTEALSDYMIGIIKS